MPVSWKQPSVIFRVRGIWRVNIDRQINMAAMWGEKPNIHTTNCLVLLNNATVASSMLRLALTSSGGVKASHWLRLMSWNWADTKRKDGIYVGWTSNLIYDSITHLSWRFRGIRGYRFQCFQHSAHWMAKWNGKLYTIEVDGYVRLTGT